MKRLTVIEHLEKHGLPESIIFHEVDVKLRLLFESLNIKVFTAPDYVEKGEMIFHGVHESERKKEKIDYVKEWLKTQ